MKTIKIKTKSTGKAVAKVAGLLFCTSLFGLTLAAPSVAVTFSLHGPSFGKIGEQATFRIIADVDPKEIQNNIVLKTGRFYIDGDDLAREDEPTFPNYNKEISRAGSYVLAKILYPIIQGQNNSPLSSVSGVAYYTTKLNTPGTSLVAAVPFMATATDAPEPLTTLGSVMGASGLVWLKKRRSEKDKLAER